MYLKELSQISGVSGDERRVRNFIREKLEAWGIKNYVDTMGNLYAFKEGGTAGEQSLMLSAHMDEVGLMISSIEKNGHLRFYLVGGVNKDFLVSKPVKIGSRGISGVIGAKAIHLQKKEERQKTLEVEQLYIDIGVKNKEEAEKHVKIGDYVTFDTTAESTDHYFRGKALDNRAGCAALLQILKRDYPFNFTAVFTVQEEVGIRGAKVAAYHVKPEIALIIETTLAVDVPGAKEQDHSTSLGSGPAFTLMDNSVITHPKLLERLIEIAEQEKRPYQFRRYTGSFTDAGAVSVSRGGVISGVISTPCRYIHTPVSQLCLDDWRHLVEIVDSFIRSVNIRGL
ncbi:MAG: M42 family metallopeptidase [Dethiobacteria bacterium]|jgi:putative aminopeptidase FrvX